MARRGTGKFRDGQLEESRCALLGYCLSGLRINGQEIPHTLLQVHDQVEVGTDGYDAGAHILEQFFKDELKNYITDDLNPLGKKIIDVVMQGGKLADYEAVMKL
jgi:hypothetical protein